MKTILIVADTIDGRLSAGARTLAGQARQLASVFAQQAIGIVIGHDIGDAAQDWTRTAGIPTIVLDAPHHRYPNAHNAAADLYRRVADTHPATICLAHTMRASQLAACLAWRLDATCVTAVETLSATSSGVTLERSVFGGTYSEAWSTANQPLVLTVLPGAVDSTGPSSPPAGRGVTAIHTATAADDRCIAHGIHRQVHADQALEKAGVIVAAGRGLGAPEAVPLLETVAAMFKNAAVGGSRGACDLGWLPHALQIGETGRTVAPALYLACGISGAPQHLAGMRDSNTIVAVNTDPGAAILKSAHVAVIEDLRTFLPLLHDRYDHLVTQGERNEDQ